MQRKDNIKQSIHVHGGINLKSKVHKPYTTFDFYKSCIKAAKVRNITLIQFTKQNYAAFE